MTVAQLDAAVAAVRDLAKKYGIPSFLVTEDKLREIASTAIRAFLDAGGK